MTAAFVPLARGRSGGRTRQNRAADLTARVDPPVLDRDRLVLDDLPSEDLAIERRRAGRLVGLQLEVAWLVHQGMILGKSKVGCDPLPLPLPLPQSVRAQRLGHGTSVLTVVVSPLRNFNSSLVG